MVVQVNNVYAERKVIDNVPYIHQVQDMEQSKFLGHNACGSTSSCMMARFNKVQPVPSSSYNGWYVWNSYADFTDKSGQNYNGYDDENVYQKDEWAMDMDSGLNHIHSVCGAHGFIVYNSQTAIDPYWGTDIGRLKIYLENHGLIVNQIVADFDLIKQNINAGLPLIGHWPSHYLVVIGYDTGEDDDEQNLVLHDPYGDKNGTWNGTTDGDEITYNYPQVRTGITFDKFLTVHPVGIYNEFPGYRNENTMSGEVIQHSQPFVDCYNDTAAHGGEGKNIFGIPWDNGQSVFVHNWPDGDITDNTIFLQDFIRSDGKWHQLVLNQEMNEVFPLHGQILLFWHNNYGYLNYGEPICDEYNAADAANGHKLVVQEFKKEGDIYYLGYDTETGEAGEYTADQIIKPSGITNIDTVLIIDSSGSMAWNDPQDLRKETAKIFVDMAQNDDQIAVVDFDNWSDILWPLQLLTENRDNIKSAIDLIDSWGGTSLSAGLLEGYNQLNSSVQPYKKAAVFLTDGIGAYNNEAEFYKNEGNDNDCWPIYTIGLGYNTNPALLQEIANTTGGQYFALTDPNQLKNVYFEIATWITGGSSLLSASATMVTGGVYSAIVSVPLNQQSTTFLTSWAGSDVDTTLKTPSNREITSTTNDFDVYHAKGLTYELYRITNPEAGNWTIEFYGTVLPPEGEVVNINVSAIGLIPQDTVSPEITLSVSPDTLWPPNHKMVLITPVITATDNCDPNPVIELTSITMNEGDETDIQVDDNGDIWLRAERSGTGDGRIYTITYTATDVSGNSAFAGATVTVPHNQ